MKVQTQNLDYLILVIGVCFSIILFFLAPHAHMVIIKDEQFYHADTLLPMEINGLLYFQGGMDIDTIGESEWSGDYPLYQYVPSPNWLYSLAGTTLIVATIRIYREYSTH